MGEAIFRHWLDGGRVDYDLFCSDSQCTGNSYIRWIFFWLVIVASFPFILFPDISMCKVSTYVMYLMISSSIISDAKCSFTFNEVSKFILISILRNISIYNNVRRYHLSYDNAVSVEPFLKTLLASWNSPFSEESFPHL